LIIARVNAISGTTIASDRAMIMWPAQRPASPTPA
jgi:hypothetical protein